MTHPTALRDDDAEHHLAGIAVLSARGARVAASRTNAISFYDPLAWRVIQAGVATISIDASNPDPIEASIEAISRSVGMYSAKLEQWVQATPAMWDTSGQIAARVLRAAANRRTAASHISALEALGFEVHWSHIT